MVFHDLWIVFQTIVKDVSVHKEILNFKSIHFLFVFKELHWQEVFLFTE